MRNFFKILLLFIIISDIFISVGFGVFAWQVASPLKPDSTENKIVIIDKGSGLQQIANQLKKGGIIKSARAFIVYAVLEGQATDMQAGVYNLSPSMTVSEIVKVMGSGTVTNYTKVTIPEGLTGSDTADMLYEASVLADVPDFLNFVGISSQNAYELYGYDFLKDINAPSLEGFLFPDTYEFGVDSSVQDIVSRLMANFEQKTSHLFNKEYVGQAVGYSPYQVLITASLLEEEVKTDEDMRLVAGVLYNRLEINMALQVDATLAYITGKKTGQITAQDKQVESPFNTYKYGGLPPAPISNPGLRAINAAMNPTPTNYLYYLSAPDGTTHFAETLEEHNKNINLYLR
ncbi:MAG: endolytic transglycosylase MltG [Candidatus Spechtbacterales bacterium]